MIKRFTVSAENHFNLLALTSIIISIGFVLALTVISMGTANAQYGSGDYSSGDFSTQQSPSDDDDTTVPPPSGDQDPANDDSDDAAAASSDSDDDLAETGQSLSALTIAVLVTVVVMTIAIFFVRPKHSDNS